MSFQLPALPYSYTALEPFLSAQTLEFHHDKHHATYVNNLNQLTQDTALADQTLETVILATYEEHGKASIFNNAAQVWNHTFYWNCMKPNGGGIPANPLLDRIIQAFGSFEQFKTEFKAAGSSQFGSGYVWLVLQEGNLKVIKTANAANPITHGAIPLLTADVWEHAYYLDYQNHRPDYLQTFLDKLVNWEFVTQQFVATTHQVAVAS